LANINSGEAEQNLCGLGFEMMACDEFEGDEAEAGADEEAAWRSQKLVVGIVSRKPPTQPTMLLPAKKGQIIEADNGGVDRLRCSSVYKSKLFLIYWPGQLCCGR
jgi:hypothetical protein